MKVIIDGKEYIEKEKVENMFYNLPLTDDEEAYFEKIEKALGFKLFAWQKSFLLIGQYRRTGKTTAEYLRLLMAVDGDPIDMTRHKNSIKGRCFCETLKAIKNKLEEAGIKTREVFFCEADKKAYEKRLNKSFYAWDYIVKPDVDNEPSKFVRKNMFT